MNTPSKVQMYQIQNEQKDSNRKSADFHILRFKPLDDS